MDNYIIFKIKLHVCLVHCMEKVCKRTFLCFLSCLFKLAWLLIHSQQECFTVKLLPAFQ